MNAEAQKHDATSPRRRYLLHLSCVHSVGCEHCSYVARIRPFAARSGVQARPCKRAFADDCDLIAAINHLLPPGSDIRDVFDHIESPNGFYYLLNLNSQEAAELGWRA